MFLVVLAPKDADFITYWILERLAGYVAGTGVPAFSVHLINLEKSDAFALPYVLVDSMQALTLITDVKPALPHAFRFLHGLNASSEILWAYILHAF